MTISYSDNVVMDIEKRCPQCGETLPAAAFHKDARTSTGLRCYCKRCTTVRFQTQFKTGPHYQKRSEKYKAQRAKQRATNPRDVWVVDAFHNAKGRAKKAGLPFTLTKQDIAGMLGDICPLLGTNYVFGKGKTDPCSPSLDRRDPMQGYTPENTWVISAKANRIKSDATVQEVIKVGAALRRLLREGYY